MLVSTTIIETGLDIPNVNTIIVDNAVDTFLDFQVFIQLSPRKSWKKANLPSFYVL